MGEIIPEWLVYGNEPEPEPSDLESGETGEEDDE